MALISRKVTAFFYLPLPKAIPVPGLLIEKTEGLLTRDGIGLTSITNHLKGTANQVSEQWYDFYKSCITLGAEKAREYKQDLILVIDKVDKSKYTERIPYKLASGRTPEQELRQLRDLLWLIGNELGVRSGYINTDAPINSDVRHGAKDQELGWTVLGINILEHLKKAKAEAAQ